MERLRIPFTGEGSGTAELSWGQQTVWRGILARGAPIIVTATDTMDGLTPEGLADQWSYMMGRHQALRTRYHFTPDGRPQQVVYESGEAFLDIIDADDDDDPLKVAKALEKRFDLAERDYENEWPLRAAVIRHRGVPAYKVLGVCHLSLDGFGAFALFADLAQRDPDTGAAPGPVTAMEPLEQARWQASDAGERQTRAAERYWARVLRAIPPVRFPGLCDERAPRYWEVSYLSRAIGLAAQTIAARVQLDTSSVLLAALAVGLTRAAGAGPAVPRLMVNNRFRPRFSDSIGPISQTSPCLIDVAGVRFDEAVKRASRASMAAFKYAYFDPGRIRQVLRDVSAERGEEIDVGVVYNDRRTAGSRTLAGHAPAPEEARAALPQSEFIWEDPSDESMDDCHIHVFDTPDGGTRLQILFDTKYVSPKAVETLLREMEAITVDAAFSPGTPTGIPAG